MKPTTLSLAAAGMITALCLNSFTYAAGPAAVQTQGNISYISGGVGDDEAAAMKSAASGYPLELQFVQKAQPRDEFLADVKVRITDRTRNVVLDTVANGPYFFAKLPPGTYQVEANHAGVVKRQNVDVRHGKRQRSVFVWSPSDEARESMANTASGTTAR